MNHRSSTNTNMNRTKTKRTRRASTTDRASEDTTASSSSTTPQQPRAKRPKKDDAREVSTADSDVQPPSPNSIDLIEELFTAVVQHTDEKGVQISNEFTFLPSRTAYPDYYTTIRKPIDLKQIAKKIQTEKYSTLDELVDDLLLMTNNAMEYNEPSSQIYKDATALKRFITGKKTEFEQRELHRTAERTVRTRRSAAQSTQPASAIYAALEYGEEEGGAGEPDGVAEMGSAEADSDDETSQAESSVTANVEGSNTAVMNDLYDTVVKLKGPGAREITALFRKLPNRRNFPDYYTIIRSPVSLTQIKKKIRKGLYVALDEMILDLQLMCQNAQIYNAPNSAIYKDSERIKNFVEGRLKEFQEEVDRSSSPLRTAQSEKLLPEYDDSLLRKRLKFIVRSIMECKEDGVYPVEMFLEKPLKKDYPDYYDIIVQPIDMKTIINKVQNDKYSSEEMLLADIKLLCENARTFNEEKSDIYKDAVKFEEIIRKAQRTIGYDSTVSTCQGSVPRRSTSGGRRSSRFPAPTSSLQASLIELYEFVTEVADETGRRRSELFQTLPLKTELPGYYDVIKKPVDLDKIQYRIQHDQYAGTDDMIEDFGQMFENAAMFNDPKSQIYKDALLLLNATMDKAHAMGWFISEVPNVRRKVQEIIQTLMESLMKLEDASGRNFSDAIADCAFSESDEGSVDESSPQLTLENIRSNVYHGRYRRLDRFQDDIFRCLENTRFSAQPDSPTYEDAVTLHTHFINKRDELCGHGGKLLTPALHYTVAQFQNSIEQERKEAKLRPASAEPPVVDPSGGQGSSSVRNQAITSEGTVEPGNGDTRSVSVGSEQYFIGDFVYLEPYEKGKAPLIVCIEDFVVIGGVTMIRGCYMYKPHETFHVASRKFFEKEVFKSDLVETHLPNRIIAKCFVMGTKDYFKMKPLGFDFKDVYVCDARYTPKTKAFRKIKIWKMPENARVQLIRREKPLTATRVPSMFADQEDPSKISQIADTCPDSEVIDIFREPVLAKSASPDPDLIFYEQKDSPIGFLKIGDCVLVKHENTHHIIKIDKIYTKAEQTFVSGTVFIFPKDLEKHSPAKVFYTNEVFQKITEHIHPVEELTNRCAVLTVKDYATCRQTEIPEDQVYIMESKIQENGQLFKRHRGARFLNVSTTSSSHATDDEIFFFEKSVNAKRVVSPFLEAALSGKLVESDTDIQESPPTLHNYDEEIQSTINDSDDLSVMTPLSPAASAAEGGSKRGKRRGGTKRSPKKVKYTVSGFILYGAEHRKNIKLQNPGLSFPDTSRLISEMWKALTPGERKHWDNEAKRKSSFINEELKTRGLTYLEGISFKGLGAKEDMDLITELEKRIVTQQTQVKAHAEMTTAAAAATNAANPPPQSFGGPPSTPLSSAPQPTTSQQAQMQRMEPQKPVDPSQGFQQQQRPQGGEVSGHIPPQALAIIQAQQQQIQRLLQQQQQTRPLFLTLPPEPPKVKRALHSEVFLQYLEANGMSGQGGKPAVPAWKRQMIATPANTPLPATVPDYWPSLLQIDAETKNRGMELLNRMWNTRNMIVTGTCGLEPVLGVNITGPHPSQRPLSPQTPVTKTSFARRGASHRK